MFLVSWGFSSVGRAPVRQTGSHRFESGILHVKLVTLAGGLRVYSQRLREVKFLFNFTMGVTAEVAGLFCKETVVGSIPTTSTLVCARGPGSKLRAMNRAA